MLPRKRIQLSIKHYWSQHVSEQWHNRSLNIAYGFLHLEKDLYKVCSEFRCNLIIENEIYDCSLSLHIREHDTETDSNISSFPFQTEDFFFLIDHYTFNKRLKRSFCLLGKNIQKQVGLVVKKTQFLLWRFMTGQRPENPKLFLDTF